MKAPLLNSINVQGKRVIVRADLDVSLNEQNEIVNQTRLTDLFPTLNWLFEKGATQVVLIGHRGRPVPPSGGPDNTFSMEPLVNFFKKNFNEDVSFVPHVPRVEFFEAYDTYSQLKSKLVILENLRFYKEEEENNSEFAEELSYFGEVYVNDAFASSHREHTSIVALPKVMKEKGQGVALGLHFEKEVKNLEKLLNEPKHPVVFLVSGAKEDKLTFLENFKKLADQVLIGGRLPLFMPEDNTDPKLIIAKLNQDKEDITIHSIEEFERIVEQAQTIFISGPLGKYEEEGHMLGTRRVFETIAKSSALKIAGGGDTGTAINKLGLTEKFDWISTGGGASLKFIATGTLSGIEALC